MTHYTATINWNREGQVFTDNHYSRAHSWSFDGGLQIPASASPHMVPLPYSNAFNVDPEEALIASVSSCHMLWFLSIAVKRGFCVDSYADEAYGIMEKNTGGHWWISRVHLRPKAIFSGVNQPTVSEIILMHQAAHQECFIANSIKAEVDCEPLIFAETGAS